MSMTKMKQMCAKYSNTEWKWSKKLSRDWLGISAMNMQNFVQFTS